MEKAYILRAPQPIEIQVLKITISKASDYLVAKISLFSQSFRSLGWSFSEKIIEIEGIIFRKNSVSYFTGQRTNLDFRWEMMVRVGSLFRNVFGPFQNITEIISKLLTRSSESSMIQRETELTFFFFSYRVFQCVCRSIEDVRY